MTLEEKKIHLANGDLLIRSEEGIYFISHGGNGTPITIDREEGERLLFDTCTHLITTVEGLVANPSPREAFRTFIRFQLKMMVEDAKVELTDEQIGKFAHGIEDDMTFYEKLEDFLAEYIEDFGENYDIY